MTNKCVIWYNVVAGTKKVLLFCNKVGNVNSVSLRLKSKPSTRGALLHPMQKISFLFADAVINKIILTDKSCQINLSKDLLFTNVNKDRVSLQ